MAVRGLELFQERFSRFSEAYVLIGGAACERWFSTEQMSFRVTQDLDIVLLLDALTPEFILALLAFIHEGGYATQERSDGTPRLYRFSEPTDPRFPVMLELFCRTPDLFIPDPGQHITPISMTDAPSLSAILLDEAYYNYLLDHQLRSRGIPSAHAAALIPLKARAWLDLSRRRDEGEQGRGSDIRKHRNDIFALTATLPSQPSAVLPEPLASDLASFLAAFPASHGEWQAIRASLRDTIGGPIDPDELIDTLTTYFQLAPPKD